MPVYQYEAMDNTGTEVKDTIEAGSEAEAQQKIKEQGFFVTKISEKGRGGKKKEPEKKKERVHGDETADQEMVVDVRRHCLGQINQICVCRTNSRA